MAAVDSVGDFLTRIRNALTAHHATVRVPTSSMREKLAEILKQEGFIRDFRMVPGETHGSLEIDLRYRANGNPVIEKIHRISTPGCRRYIAAKDLVSREGGIATTILTTSKGVMTGQQAREANVGGELICEVV